MTKTPDKDFHKTVKELKDSIEEDQAAERANMERALKKLKQFSPGQK